MFTLVASLAGMAEVIQAQDTDWRVALEVEQVMLGLEELR
jgi:hypothetical protein